MKLNELYDPPELVEVYVVSVEPAGPIQVLREGKWINGRFFHNIRIDQPTSGAGQIHAHVLGRKGNEIGIVNIDGSASHRTKCKLPNEDAEALRARGFTIPNNNIVEWSLLKEDPGEFLTG